MHRWFLAALLVGCAEEVELLPDDVNGPPQPDLYADRAVAGRPMTLTIDDVAGGEPVEFAWAKRAGRGPCLAAYGGVCLDLVNPQRLGSAVSDRSGHAELTVTLPRQLGGLTEISLQAIVGTGGNAHVSLVQTLSLQQNLPDPLYTRAQTPQGFVAFTPDSIEVQGDTIWVAVGYGGGCAQHDFLLQWDGQFSLAQPPAVDLRLWHNGHGDMCQAFIMEKRRFDLADIRAAYGAAQPEGLVVNVDREQAIWRF